MIAFIAASGEANASGPAAPAFQDATTTATAVPNVDTAPGNLPGSQPGDAPSPVDTAEGAPQAAQTGQPPPVPSGFVPGGGTGPSDTDVPGTTAPTSGGGFPWLIILAIGLLVLAGLGYAVMRQRSPVQATEAQATPMRRRADVRDLAGSPPGGTPTTVVETTTTTTATPETAPTVPLPQADSTVAATEPFTPPATDTLTCPNCGTANAPGENFCRECGEDLRSVAATAAMGAAGAGVGVGVTGAAAPPVDIIEEDTPYLETLDRIDEQLEFVLSRPRVVLGTAAGNDIVIDAAFRGHDTVSPIHAELRREQEGFVLIDRGSEQGTFVNEMRTGENILSDGDLVRLGDVRFVFRTP